MYSYGQIEIRILSNSSKNSFVGRRIVKVFKRSENLQSHLRGQLENASTLENKRTDLLISKLTIA